jgi:alpha-galactosidase
VTEPSETMVAEGGEPGGAFAPLVFPSAAGGADPRTRIVLGRSDGGLATVHRVGLLDAFGAGTAAAIDATDGSPVTSLLDEHAGNRFTRPGLRGHRLAGGRPATAAGRDWSPVFVTVGLDVGGEELVVDAVAADAQLRLRTEIQSLPGGALRLRHALTNDGTDPYLVEGLEVVVPVPDHLTELLDFTGRHEAERTPQRHQLADGLWLREQRRGKPGADAATVLVAGTPGFGFASGEVLAVHVAWSGNSVLGAERTGASGATLRGGELLQPGEMVLEEGESYTGPWVYVVAADDGLDSVAAAFHRWLRSRPAHPERQPVTLNVWEAVYFDHGAERLSELATLAARVGVERFVLDDGWFHRRRNDRAGLGDWWVDETVWPDGLGPLIDTVHAHGMQFGLWFEPEMVNPASDTYEAHPDWILSAGGRVPALHRNQLVLDLTRDEVRDTILARMDAVLRDNAVDFVKWDHNRDLLDAGTVRRGGAPAVHDQTVAYYALLDELRDRHPGVAWESCSAGGARIDLEVLDRVQRVWTSDNTDALARQSIQRWTAQLVAPEYLGAHVSAPVSHQTGRSFTLDFRAATALFWSFGVEWDLTAASDEELDRLAAWVDCHKRLRPLLHRGRMVRLESADPAVIMHGVVAADRREAVLAHVQLHESTHSRGVVMRVPGLDPASVYRLGPAGPSVAVDAKPTSGAAFVLDPPRRGDVEAGGGLASDGVLSDVVLSGGVLGTAGLWVPKRQPETVTLVHLTAVD